MMARSGSARLLGGCEAISALILRSIGEADASRRMAATYGRAAIHAHRLRRCAGDAAQRARLLRMRAAYLSQALGMRAAFPSHALRTSLALLVAALLTAATCSAKAQDVSG